MDRIYFTKEEVAKAVDFQEQYFENYIEMYLDSVRPAY